MLPENERALLHHLSVFFGGCTLSTAQTLFVADNDHDEIVNALTSLCDKNLLLHSAEDDEPRFRMLETIREFAVKALESSDDATLWRQRHAAHFLAMAENADSELLTAEVANLRAALQWSLEFEPLMALRLAVALWRFWERRGQSLQARHWLEEALRANPDAPPLLRAHALVGAGKLAWFGGDFASAGALLQSGLEIGRTIHDAPTVAAALLFLGNLASYEGDFRKGETLLREALAMQRDLDDREGTATALLHLSHATINLFDAAQTRVLLEESLQITRELNDNSALIITLYYVGDAAMIEGDYDRAEPTFEEALALAHRVGDRVGGAYITFGLAWLTRERGQFESAQRYLREGCEIIRDNGHGWVQAYYMESAAYLAAAQGQNERAAQLLGAAATLRTTMSCPLAPSYHALHQRYEHLARTALGEASFQALYARGHTFTVERALQLVADNNA